MCIRDSLRGTRRYGVREICRTLPDLGRTLDPTAALLAQPPVLADFRGPGKQAQCLEIARRRSGSWGPRDHAGRMGVLFPAGLDFEDRR
eukprot:10349875-Alexandrium_andersonii.AAC.1